MLATAAMFAYVAFNQTQAASVESPKLLKHQEDLMEQEASQQPASDVYVDPDVFEEDELVAASAQDAQNLIWNNLDDGELFDGEPESLDTNIDNARVEFTPREMAMAASHHHKHSVHGKMSMGAHTGKKGAFGWHAKFPVGGKGRR